MLLCTYGTLLKTRPKAVILPDNVKDALADILAENPMHNHSSGGSKWAKDEPECLCWEFPRLSRWSLQTHRTS